MREASKATSSGHLLATLPNCGKFLKFLLPRPLERGVQHQGNDLGDGNNVGNVTMDNPQPSPKSLGYGCSSTTKWWWARPRSGLRYSLDLCRDAGGIYHSVMDVQFEKQLLR